MSRGFLKNVNKLLIYIFCRLYSNRHIDIVGLKIAPPSTAYRKQIALDNRKLRVYNSCIKGIDEEK